MKGNIYFICAITSFFYSAKSLPRIPEARISNGIISAGLYLPNGQDRYYNGSRFDWSGQIFELKYKGHSFFGQWFKTYDPAAHDAIMGPVEAFNPLGYDAATPGGSFVKIGVGTIIKPDTSAYQFFNSYRIIDPGTWKVSVKADQVEFVHTLHDSNFSYVYTKTVRLIPGKPEMVLSHTLKNIGKRTIETSVMNHNFFVIDDQPTGSDFVIEFPFKLSLSPAQDDSENGDHIRGNQIVFDSGDPEGKKFILKDIIGFRPDAKDYDIRVNNVKTGAGARITSDRPLSKMIFWASSKTVCPEPYIEVKAEPGSEFKWNTTYRFSSEQPRAKNHQ